MRTTRLFTIALLATLASACEDDDEATIVMPVQTPVPVGVEQEPPVPHVKMEVDDVEQVLVVTEVATQPEAWSGRIVSGTVEVTSVPSDRGFWVEQDGAKLFAILIDRPEEQPVDINEGQTLRIDKATVRTPAELGQIPGRPLEDETVRIANEQQVVLVVDEANLDILARADEEP